MDLWMKSIWVLAALLIVLCLVGLAGGGDIASEPGVAPRTMEYFTARDPARAAVDYGVREGGRTLIYSSKIAP
jgi:hypothetical protein